MSQSEPKFSLLIPTRNRAHMLKHAIASALSQTCGDFEVVVSNNDSTDETEQLLQSIDDPRFRYVNTDQTLAAPYHWEWAVKHVKGEYVTLLCDDDALSPHACERALKAFEQSNAQMILWHRTSYIYPSWQGKEVGNTIRVHQYTGKLEEKPAKENLKAWFESCSYLKHSPMLFNCFCKRSLIQSVSDEGRVFFMPPAPDVGASLCMLDRLETFHYLDSPMSLAGVSPDSIGATFSTTRGDAAKKFEKEFKKPVNELTPCKITTLVNLVAETLLWSQKHQPEFFAQYELNWTNYWTGCLFDMEHYQLNGMDVREDLASINQLIDQLDPAMQQDIRKQVKTRIAKIKRHDRKTWLRRKFLGGLGSRSKTIHGNKSGFSNIYECAMKLDQITGFNA